MQFKPVLFNYSGCSINVPCIYGCILKSIIFSCLRSVYTSLLFTYGPPKVFSSLFLWAYFQALLPDSAGPPCLFLIYDIAGDLHFYDPPRTRRRQNQMGPG